MRHARFCGALFAAAFVLPALAQEPKPETKPGTLAVGYTIAFWAIPFGHTDYHAKFDGDSYDAKSHFETSGVVSLFWNSIIDANANGAIAAHTITPALYDSWAEDHSSKKRRVKVTFGGPVPETFADPVFSNNKYPVTDEQKRGAVDPMSALTTIMAGIRADAKNPCGTGVEVFDGHRRYDVTFSYVKDEKVTVPGVFDGNAHQCLIHYNQIAGYKQKIVKEGKALPPMYADFADVPGAGSPDGRYVVAVKLWTSLTWGTVTATISELKVNTKG
ncbi:MAG TPA: DUF3108 domain-containing protein [Rhizomicrobium sp.]|jgi:hypothetical protein